MSIVDSCILHVVNELSSAVPCRDTSREAKHEMNSRESSFNRMHVHYLCVLVQCNPFNQITNQPVLTFSLLWLLSSNRFFLQYYFMQLRFKLFGFSVKSTVCIDTRFFPSWQHCREICLFIQKLT